MNYFNDSYLPGNIPQGFQNSMANNTMNDSPGFRNLYGFIGKVLLIAGGIQGLFSLFQCLLDVAYFMKLAKSVFTEYILYFIKKLLLLIRYIITLRWILDFLKSINNKYIYYVYQAKYFKYFSFTYKITLSLGLLTCILMKLYKSHQLINIEHDKDKIAEETEKKSGFPYNKLSSNNEMGSEERWKEYIKTMDPENK